jgi:hypothetical protein
MPAKQLFFGAYSKPDACRQWYIRIDTSPPFCNRRMPTVDTYVAYGTEIQVRKLVAKLVEKAMRGSHWKATESLRDHLKDRFGVLTKCEYNAALRLGERGGGCVSDSFRSGYVEAEEIAADLRLQASRLPMRSEQRQTGNEKDRQCLIELMRRNVEASGGGGVWGRCRWGSKAPIGLWEGVRTEHGRVVALNLHSTPALQRLWCVDGLTALRTISCDACLCLKSIGSLHTCDGLRAASFGGCTLRRSEMQRLSCKIMHRPTLTDYD